MDCDNYTVYIYFDVLNIFVGLKKLKKKKIVKVFALFLYNCNPLQRFIIKQNLPFKNFPPIYTFPEQKTEVDFIENQYLPGVLIAIPRAVACNSKT